MTRPRRAISSSANCTCRPRTPCTRNRQGTVGPRWQQYDLRTGARGKACDYNLAATYYIGTDCTVAVLEYGNPNVGRVTKAYDLATCDTLWKLRSAVGSFREVWRINTTLVQLSEDGTELVSPVAPS